MRKHENIYGALFPDSCNKYIHMFFLFPGELTFYFLQSNFHMYKQVKVGYFQQNKNQTRNIFIPSKCQLQRR